MKKFLIITITIFIVITQNTKAEAIPDLVGEWSGDNDTFSELKGMKTWRKNVKITEQNDRRFKGHFTYSAGTKNFYGIIHPDNVTITWVASDSRGYNFGKILEKNKISDDIGALTIRTIASKNDSSVSFPDEKSLTENIVLDLNYSVLMPVK